MTEAEMFVVVFGSGMGITAAIVLIAQHFQRKRSLTTLKRERDGWRNAYYRYEARNRDAS